MVLCISSVGLQFDTMPLVYEFLYFHISWYVNTNFICLLSISIVISVTKSILSPIKENLHLSYK